MHFKLSSLLNFRLCEDSANENGKTLDSRLEVQQGESLKKLKWNTKVNQCPDGHQFVKLYRNHTVTHSPVQGVFEPESVAVSQPFELIAKNSGEDLTGRTFLVCLEHPADESVESVDAPVQGAKCWQRLEERNRPAFTFKIPKKTEVRCRSQGNENAKKRSLIMRQTGSFIRGVRWALFE